MLGPNQQKWIDDLRSGNFPQDTSGKALKTPEGYCCLGVAAAGLGHETHCALPLRETIETLALRDDWGSADDDDLRPCCTRMNDQLKWSFSQIADHLTLHAEEYFHEPR